METDLDLNADLVLAAVDLMGRGGREGAVRVQGQSMLPTLRPGQLLAVDFAPQRLAVGDMLVFRQVDMLLVHRLLGSARPLEGHRRLRTRGDGVLNLDPPVELDRVVGRVVAIENDGCWRSVRQRPARIYARLLALHDFFWSGLASLFRPVDRLLLRFGVPLRFRRMILVIDRFTLRRIHWALFERVHPEIPNPVSDTGTGGQASA